MTTYPRKSTDKHLYHFGYVVWFSLSLVLISLADARILIFKGKQAKHTLIAIKIVIEITCTTGCNWTPERMGPVSK